MAKTKRGLKKSLAVLLAAVLALSSMWCFTAFAAGDVKYIDGNGTEQSVVDGNYTSVTSSSTTWSNSTYVVDSDVTVSTRITVSGNVTLILVDGCTLTAEDGVAVLVDNTLVIYGQDEGTGKLVATGTTSGNSGIGGNNGASYAQAGTIIINGGTVDATGGNRAAGIGSGSNTSSNSYGITGGTITINGGTVTANGPSVGYGAAIGGGRYTSAGNITITGGDVTATGGSGGYAAGIGSGYATTDTTSGTINISGGNITATTGDYGAGIGCGYTAAGGTINISGGYVDATGGSWAAGIGGGSNGDMDNLKVTITGGYVSAKGGYYGAGIGGGRYESGGTAVISGGTVVAACGSSGKNGIGIGNSGKEPYSFSTGKDGCAIIYASAIVDESDIDNWSGVISKDGTSAAAIVYGSPVITTDEWVPSGKRIMIEEDKTLSVATGSTLTNYSRIYQYYGSTFNKNTDKYGTLIDESNDDETLGTLYEIVQSDGTSLTFTANPSQSYTTYYSRTYAEENVVLTESNSKLYTVDNYSKDADISVSDYKFTMPAEPVLLTAIAITELTLTYDANGKEVEQSYTYPTYETVKIENDFTTTVASGEGIVDFQSWNTAADGTGKTYYAGDKITLTEDTTLYAQAAHTIVEVPAKAATCTEDGNEAYYICTGCGAMFADETGTVEIDDADVVISAHGHTYAEMGREAPTCLTTGYIFIGCACECCEECECNNQHYEFWNGDKFNYMYAIELAAFGHNYGEPEFEWTKTDDGYTCTATITCLNDANHILTADSCEVTSETTDPSCEAAGETVYTATATFRINGGEVEYTDTKSESIPALGHTEVTDEAVEPTCTEDGLTEGSHCAVCGEILEYGTEVIPANGHTAGEKEYDEDSYVAPTETEDGSIDWVIRCTDCGEILETGTEVIPATGVTSDGSTTAGGSSTTAHSGLVAVEVVDPETGETYTVYYDPDTGIYYSDAEGTIEIDADSFILLEDYEEEEEDEELDEDEEDEEEEAEVKADTSETSPNTGASLAALAIAMGTAAAGIVVVSRKKKEDAE